MGSRLQTLIHRFPNGEIRYTEMCIIRIRTHKIRRGTQGTETSKYLQEKKENSIPKVVASEIGGA